MKVFIPQSGIVYLSHKKKIKWVSRMYLEMILKNVLKEVFEKDSDFS